MSVGNWDNNGQWIPLMYFTNSLNRSAHDIKVGEINGTKVKIRGYTVPFLVQNTTNPLRVNLTVCGESVVRRGLQIRWLQTTSLYVATSYEVKDAWTLNAVYTSFPSCALKNSTDNSSNSMRWVWHLKKIFFHLCQKKHNTHRPIELKETPRNSDFSSMCSSWEELVLGATCSTIFCDIIEG